MSTSKSEPVPSPLVDERFRLKEQAGKLMAEATLLAAKLAAKKKELDAVHAQLIALGAGRYCSPADPLIRCTVVDAVSAVMSADTFELRNKEDELQAREIAGDAFLKLFKREVYFTPKPDFRGLALGMLSPKKAESLITLCLIPGQPTGGRAAYVTSK